MASAEQIRNNLIDKLISIKNKELLSAVDRLLEVSVKEEDVYKVSEDQRKALQASEIDIANDSLISDEDLKSNFSHFDKARATVATATTLSCEKAINLHLFP